jgi:hypothetical protein
MRIGYNMIDGAKGRYLFLSIIITFFLAIAATGSIISSPAASQLSLHNANAQGDPITILIHGNITAAIRHKSFGGEAIGTYSVVVPSEQKVEININLYKLP